MRKIALVLALIAMASFAFALDISVSGSATTTFGVDFLTGDAGLKSETSTDIDMTIGEGSATSEASGEWYGEISVTGAKLWIGDKDYNDDGDMDDTGTVSYALGLTANEDDALHLDQPSVAAKITNGTIYITLASKPDFGFDKVTELEDGEATDLAVSADAGAIAIGMSDDVMMIEFQYGNDTDWESGDLWAVHVFALKGSYTLSDALAIEAGVGVEHVPGAVSAAAGVKATGTVSLVTYEAALDYGYDSNDVEASAKATFAISDDISAYVQTFTNVNPFAELDLKAGFDGTFGMLTVGGSVLVTEVIEAVKGLDSELTVSVAATDDITLKAFLEVDSTDLTGDPLQTVKLELSATANLLENTSFVLMWDGEGLTDAALSKSVLTFATSISL